MENEKEIISDNVHGEMAMASTTIYNKKCHHCGRPVHVKADCFHNPESASYCLYQERKGSKYRSNSNKGRKNGKRSPYRPNREYENKKDSGKSGYVTFIANKSNIQSPATPSQASEWFIDSGASAHMSFEDLWFRTPLSKTEKMNVTVGNGEQCEVRCRVCTAHQRWDVRNEISSSETLCLSPISHAI